ncbi:MAG: hypothetical protein BWY95_00198 [Bacteroidetes bacterium ADurb.BinA104]|nr:MAG: hypothetical protein BWY95_00198 [Bacteroidetes bacterium ADurb.BinA104]
MPIKLISKELTDPSLNGRFGFLVAHLHTDRSSRRVSIITKKLYEQIDTIINSFIFLMPHTILLVIHPRDYVIRDWRSLPVLPLLFSRIRDVPCAHFLSTITLANSQLRFTGTTWSKQDGTLRPFFPYRTALEASMFLINRDSTKTFDKWSSKVDALNTVRRVDVWRSSRVKDSYDLSPYEYKSLLDLFCHPQRIIYDPLPLNGGFAIASADIGRNYVGVYKNVQLMEQVARRIAKVREAQANEDRHAIVAPSTRVRKLKKAANVLGWRSRVR